MPWATNERAVAERGLTEARRSGDVRRSVRYLGADLGVFFLVPEGFLRKSRGSSKAFDGLPRPSSTGLKAAHSSKASLMWGWTKDDSFLRWNWARSARFRSTRSDADGFRAEVGPLIKYLFRQQIMAIVSTQRSADESSRIFETVR